MDLETVGVEQRPIILVVEDDPANREYLQAVLEAAHRVLAVDGARELWRVLSLLRDDVGAMLLDIELPGGEDGLTLTRKLRRGDAGERWRHVPILAITSHSDLQQEAKAAGCDGYFRKPTSPGTILDLVRRALDAATGVSGESGTSGPSGRARNRRGGAFLPSA